MKKILITGASGYIGGQLLKELEKKGHDVRCLARRPDPLQSTVGKNTDVVSGDVLNKESLEAALKGREIAYYLVHSMQEGNQFEEADRQGARNFAEAAKAAGVKKIIYLGGLGNDKENLSPHLNSRHEVGRILKESGAIVIEFRASIVIGSGSLSFEMIRALVERLPIMITPRWVRVIAQPIAIHDLLLFLLTALESHINQSAIYEIGGKDRLSYKGIMDEYARQRGLRRLMIPVPVLTPRLSGLWLGLVTPLYARVGRTLIKSIIHPTVVNDNKAETIFRINPIGVKDAIKQAIEKEDHKFIIDTREIFVPAPSAKAFDPIRRIGGSQGWYYGNALWKLRGFVDLLAGGVGLRRGRKHPSKLLTGDPLDFWRVEEIEENKRLRLKAEMKLPGRAWLQFDVNDEPKGSTIRQTAIFDPIGLSGLLYWYLLYPLHTLIFSGMLRGIKNHALH